jgi:hypothetical protein
MDPAGWEWLRAMLIAEHRHLVIGTSLPYLLPPGLHYVESWNEAVCDGAWGQTAARIAEKIRQGIDLEHWAAFSRSFHTMARLLTDLPAECLGSAPTSIGFLSGDVHYSYLARAKPPPATASTIYQIVCSPIRNPLPRPIRLLNSAASFGAAGLVGRALARLARLPRAPLKWKVDRGPFYQNALGVLDLDPDRVEVRWTAPDMSSADPPRLRQLARQRLV